MLPNSVVSRAPATTPAPASAPAPASFMGLGLAQAPATTASASLGTTFYTRHVFKGKIFLFVIYHVEIF